MKYPDFFDEVESIEMYDPLAETLGAAEEGRFTYSYLDIVKFAGHSCPTVAGAWIMTSIALKKLYCDELPVRGEIRVEMRGALDEGVEGVIGSCIGFITGAANEGGFKGLGGRMARNNRLIYGVEMEGEVRVSRLDSGESVELAYNPSIVPGNPEQQILMQKVLQGAATPDEKRRFAQLWQERVKRILLQRELWKEMVTLF